MLSPFSLPIPLGDKASNILTPLGNKASVRLTKRKSDRERKKPGPAIMAIVECKPGGVVSWSSHQANPSKSLPVLCSSHYKEPYIDRPK